MKISLEISDEFVKVILSMLFKHSCRTEVNQFKLLIRFAETMLYKLDAVHCVPAV